MMKNILSIFLAILMIFSLSVVAFADDVAMLGSNHDQVIVPVVKEDKYDKIVLSGCFDGDEQYANIAFDGDYLSVNDEPIVFATIAGPEAYDATAELNKEISDIEAKWLAEKGETTFTEALMLEYLYTPIVQNLFSVKNITNSMYMKKLTIVPEITWVIKDQAYVAYVSGMYVTATPADYAISANKTVTAEIYAGDNNALSASYQFACTLEIEWRNHYIDVYVDKDGKSETYDPLYANAFGTPYTTESGKDDFSDVLNAKKALILRRYYTHSDPSYVVYAEQFKTLPVKTPIAFEYADLVKVTLSDGYIQDNGLNFKYDEGQKTFTKDELYKIPEAKAYYFNFFSTEDVDSITTIEFLNRTQIQKILETKDAYLYVSADGGKTYDYVGAYDLEKEVKVNIEAGSVLGYWMFTNYAPITPEVESGKDNVGTGMGNALAVCGFATIAMIGAAATYFVNKKNK